MNFCDDMPDIVQLSDYNGQWDRYILAIYAIFEKNMINERPMFLGNPVTLNTEPIFDGKIRSFWHVISEGKGGDENRLPDLRRCESISWIKPLIQEDNTCVHHKVWAKYHDKTKKDRWYIWCDELDYVVILEDRGSVFRLITAFNVTFNSKRVSFENEYLLYEKTKAPIGR